MTIARFIAAHAAWTLAAFLAAIVGEAVNDGPMDALYVGFVVVWAFPALAVFGLVPNLAVAVIVHRAVRSRIGAVAVPLVVWAVIVALVPWAGPGVWPAGIAAILLSAALVFGLLLPIAPRPDPAWHDHTRSGV
jgi:hypothetical protein